ncbi:transporter substrate-binding domain-containing protein [Thiospirillum jenense]|uniref:Sensory/regulatory protein RpfC n=1 Tax=Thiospirillum jenense TaxID=1653858 RepID=A0A839H9L9_9GAMM|nr:transporter substrate-binding domain-containing protein [Thiospirillum jenense]
MTLQLTWKHQFEFAGFYAAIAKGFYRDRGLEVTLREYQSDLDVCAEVLSGRVTYGLTNSSVISWRLTEKPVKLLANYFKKPALVLLSQSGLRTLDDLRGKRLMMTDQELNTPLIQSALREAGLVPGSNITIVPHTFSTTAFIRGEIEAMTAFLSNEPFELEQKGVAFQIIELTSYLPGLGDDYLFTTNAEVNNHPEQTRAFIEASNQGWQYALDHPDEIIELILNRYTQRKSREALQYEAKKIRQLMLTNISPIGTISTERISLAANSLLEAGQEGDRANLNNFLFDQWLNTDQIILSDAEHAWIAKHPKVVFGTDERWYPFVQVKEDGSIIGIEPDLLARIRALTGLNIRLKLGHWSDIVEEAERGELDGLAISAALPERADRFLFTDSYYSVSRFIFTRGGITSPLRTMSDLNGKRVGYLRGVAAESNLLAKWPTIIAVEDEFNNLITQLLSGQIDAIVSSLALLPILRKQLIPDIGVAFPIPSSETKLCYSVLKKYPELHSIINKALAVIGQKTIDNILAQWGTVIPETAIPLILTAEERDWLVAHPKIVLGISDQFQPDIIVNPDGGYTGLVADYIELINRQLGDRIILHVESDWQTVTNKAITHTIDGLALSSPNPTWDQHFIYTDPFYQGYLYYYALSEHPIIHRLDELGGKRVGYLSGMKKIEHLLETQSNIIAIGFNSNEIMAQALLEKRVDVVVGLIDFEWWRQHNIQLAMRIVGVVENSRHPAVMSIRNDWSILAQILNKVLRNLSPSEQERIRQRWLTNTSSILAATTELLLSSSESAWLAKHQVIRYGIYSDWAPIEYLDQNQHAAGIVPEYLSYLERLLNIRFEAIPVKNWTVGLQLLERGHIDILPALAQTPERQLTFHFTPPYLTFPVAIFAPIDAPFYGNLDALAGKRVGVVADYTLSNWLYHDHPELTLQSFLDINSALHAVAAYEVDAVISGLVTTSHAISHTGLIQIRMAGTTPYEIALSMAVRKDWAILAELLTRALAAIPQHERDSIQSRWIQVSHPTIIDYMLVWQIVGVGLLVLMIVLHWNRKLMREIKKRRRAEYVVSRHRAILRATLDATDDGILVVNADGIVLIINARFQQLWYLPDELVLLGQESRLLVHMFGQLADVEDLPQFNTASVDASERSVRDLLYLKDGRIFERYTRSLKIDQQPARLWSFRDITEHQKLQTTLKETKELAELANRAKSDFLANISHEIRTPMNAVMGMLHLCLDTELTAQQHSYLEKSYSASQALFSLLNDILDFSRIEAGRLTLETVEFELDMVLNHVAAVIGYAAEEKGLAFRLERATGVSRALLGDPLRLEQILTNLGDNAVKFTEQGEVRIHTHWHTIESNRALLEVRVQDTGIGIPPEKMKCLFEPFSQGDNSSTRRYGGTGLGLAISQHLVDMMGGVIKIDSRVGNGSTFHFQVWFSLACTAALPAPAIAYPADVIPITPAADFESVLLALEAPLTLSANLCAVLIQLHSLVSDHDPTAEDVLRDAQPLLAAALPPVVIKMLTDTIEDYHFETAAAHLERLLSTQSVD